MKWDQETENRLMVAIILTKSGELNLQRATEVCGLGVTFQAVRQHFQKIQKRFPEIVEAIANNTNVAGPVDEGSPVKGDNVLGEASNTTATPKKRGRKPANPPADEGTPVKGDNVLDDVSTTATPKKRGRKPANTPSGDPKTPSKRRKIVKSDKRVHDSDDSAEKESQKKPGADVVDHADEENAS